MPLSPFCYHYSLFHYQTHFFNVFHIIDDYILLTIFKMFAVLSNMCSFHTLLANILIVKKYYMYESLIKSLKLLNKHRPFYAIFIIRLY